MKKKIFSVLFALVLLASFSLVTAVPAAATTFTQEGSTIAVTSLGTPFGEQTLEAFNAEPHTTVVDDVAFDAQSSSQVVIEGTVSALNLGAGWLDTAYVEIGLRPGATKTERNAGVYLIALNLSGEGGTRIHLQDYTGSGQVGGLIDLPSKDTGFRYKITLEPSGDIGGTATLEVWVGETSYGPVTLPYGYASSWEEGAQGNLNEDFSDAHLFYSIIAECRGEASQTYSATVGDITIDDTLYVGTGQQFTTIQEAIDFANPGDTISVAAGTYSEWQDVSVFGTGKSTGIMIDKSLIVVSVDGAAVTIIDAQEAAMGVLINGEGTIATFDGFTVENYDTIGILAGAFGYWGEDPEEVHILNNIVKPPTLAEPHNNCIQVGDGTTGTIIGNEASGATLESPDWSGSGIIVAGSSNVLVSNNYAHDCELGICIIGYAVNRVAPAENNIVENNLVEGNVCGISVQMNSIGTIIRYNDALNNDIGIGSVGNISWEPTIPSGTEIHFNNIVGNVDYGVKSSVWDEGLGGPEEVDVTNNWWGDISGPTHAGNTFNVGEQGDAVSDNVLYCPWYDTDMTGTSFAPVVNTDTGGQFSSIQAAIDAANPNDTISVVGGTYDETITFATVDGLTISGDPADRPVIDGGVKFNNSTPINGITFENLYFKGTAQPSPNERIFWMNNSAAVNDFAMDNCVLDGEQTEGRIGIAGNKFAGSFSITYTEFKDIYDWAVMDIDASYGGLPIGGNEFVLTTVTFANNHIHECNGSVALRGNHATKTLEVNVYENIIDNIGGNGGLDIPHWAGIEVNHAVVANVYDNTVTNIIEGEWGEGQAFQFWDIDTLNVYGNDITNNYQGIFIYGGEEGGAFGGPYAIPDGSISFNNIFGNDQYGVAVDPNAAGGPLNATNNWWGHASGPIHVGTNPLGTGNAVSDNVDFEPWFGAGVEDSKSEETGTGDDTIDAKTEADTVVDKSGAGTPTITVAKYTSNPGTGFSGDTGKYIDVHVDDPTGVTEIEIKVYYTNAEIAGLVESSLILRWWDGTRWIGCSDSGVNTTDIPPYSGYIWAKIRNDTIPTLDQLSGTVFGGSGRAPIVGPAPPPVPPPGTTDVRGKVSTAGVFTRSVTAISEDGLCTLTIPEGTVGLTEELEPLDEITIVIMDEPPPPPEAAHIIGLVYDFQPSGATFEPPIPLTFSYDPADIPEGIAEEDLVLAFYDEATGEWVELEGVVDPVTNTITALVAHFTAFGATFIPAPAAFSLSGLEVSPAEVEIGSPVTISAVVENTGEKEGTCEVTLKINDKVGETKEVALEPGASETVTFTTSRDVAGSYSVDVNGLTGSFAVKAPPELPPEEAPPEEAPPEVKPISWPLVGGLIAAVVVIVGLLIFFLVRRRATT